MPKMFNAVIIIIIIIILITIIIFFASFFKYRYILLCLGDNWEFVKAFVSIAFFIYISSLTKIILDIRFLLGCLINFLFHMDYYRFSWILIKTSRRSSLLTGNLRFFPALPIGVRAIFRQGGGKLFALKILASCPIFYETVKKKWGSYDATT